MTATSDAAGKTITFSASIPRPINSSRPRGPMVATTSKRLTAARRACSRRRDGRDRRPRTALSESQPPPLHSRVPPIWWYMAAAPHTFAAMRALSPCGTRLNPMTQSGRVRRATTTHIAVLAKARPTTRLSIAGGVITRTFSMVLPGALSATRMISPTPGLDKNGRRCAVS